MKRITLVFAIFILCLVCLCSCSLFGCKHSEVVDAAVAPTCTSEGLTEGKHCSKCGEVTVAQQKVAPIEHTKVILEAKDPTCTEDGLTAGVRCSVCDTTVIAQQTVPAAHKYGEWNEVSQSDCFLHGKKERACSVCGEVESEELETLSHSFVQNSETGLFSCEKCDAVIFAGHLYAAFDVENNWYEAYMMCEEMEGYLVTITSEKEQNIVTMLAGDCAYAPNDNYSYIGYYYWTGALYNGNKWNWVTEEAFEYTNWSATDPDHSPAQWHIVISVGIDDKRGPANELGDWEDSEHSRKQGFICEWELDIVESEHYFTEWETVTEVSCFGDGEEYRICTHCGIEETRVLKQLEHNFVLDETTGVNACEHCSASLYEGRMYLIVTENMSWFSASAHCEKLGGHLATITSAEEQAFIESYMNAVSFSDVAWIGAFNDGVKWRWITDEAYEYTNWAPGQPDCSGSKEFFAYINYQTFGQWNDGTHDGKIAFICEWEVN